MIDEANFSIVEPSAVETTKIKHHTVQYSVIGRGIIIYLNNNPINPAIWRFPVQLIDWHSKNLTELELELDYNKLFTNKILEEQLDGAPAEGQEYRIKYFLRTSENTGIFGEVIDEIDRYLTKFIIDYNDNGEQKQVDFFVPNSVFKYLLGYNIEEPTPWIPMLTISPNDSSFTEFFSRLYDIIDTFESDPVNGDPWKVLAYTKIVNRNTPPGYSQPENPFLDTLMLIKSIATPDVLEHDALYPTLVSVKLEDFYS